MSLFGSKPTFKFEIIFRLPEGKGLHHEGEIPDLILPPNGIRVKLKLINKVNLEGFDSLILKAGDFPSENEASKYASKITNSIYLSGLLLKKAFKIIEISISEQGVLYLGGSGISSSSKPLDSFMQNFKKAVDLSYKLNDKQSLALELYNMSHFETSQRAKFITLISAIECLSEQKERSNAIIAHLNDLGAITNNSELDKSEKDSLLKNYEYLKKESHTASCSKLIKEKLDKEAAEAFRKYYDIRGDIVHEGKPKEGIDLANELSGLDNLVSKLLGAVISESN